MADTKISALPAATPQVGDQFPFVRSGVTSRAGVPVPVGTVSQSGGVPTGAIIERGSNANGSFVKYADGTMICWSPVIEVVGAALTTAAAGGFRNTGSLIGTWTFPVAFSVAPTVVTQSTTTNHLMLTPGTPTTTSTSPLGWRATSATVDTAWVGVAFGRWF